MAEIVAYETFSYSDTEMAVGKTRGPDFGEKKIRSCENVLIFFRWVQNLAISATTEVRSYATAA